MRFWSNECLLLCLLVLISFHFDALLPNSLALQPSSYSCPDYEKSALLHFKQSFTIDCAIASEFLGPYPKIESWGADRGDCCSWDGVSCDEETGHVTFLDLSSSCLYGTFPSNSTLFKLTHLQHLNLGDNHFNHSRIPSEIGRFSKLVSLNLSESVFSGQIPLAISNLRMLSVLDLSFQKDKADSELKLQDPSLEKLVQNLTHLKELSLDYVDISSSVPIILANLTFLKVVSLELCNLYGQFPTSIFHLPHLEELYLGGNQHIEGFLPEFQGFEKPVMVLPWHQLEILYLQNNKLQGSLPIPPSSMVVYQVSDNKLAGSIPHQICQVTSMKCLDISNNSLSGQIPNCISDLSSSLLVLNLECNKFNGTIPQPYPKSCKLKMINLSSNQLGGSLPRSLANCLDLEVLDVGRNHVNDTFPSWLGGLPNLHILVLRYNRFHGKIGKPDGSLDFHSRRIIDLSNNYHTGDLPIAYLQNWNAMKLLDESQSIASGTTFHFTKELDVIFMEREEYNYSITITNKGHDLQYMKVVLTVFRAIDFSSNNFTGMIPNCIGEMRGLEALNLSNNNLQGEIPSSLANMSHLESLDLSNNRLSGQIPQDLTQLTSLEVFNVSYNLLKGPIPQGSQFGTFDNSSFISNSGLCGTPLSNKCGNPSEPEPSSVPKESADDTEEDSMLIDWIIRCLGYIGGLGVGCAFGKYITNRYHEWFMDTFGRRRTGPRPRGKKAARPTN